MSSAQKQSPVDSAAAFARAFQVSRETLERLNLYESLLRRWQPAVNLVAPSTLDQVWHRHFADSAQLLALMPPRAMKFADLGSGGGFPGLVLAILLAETRPAARYTLIESDQRKCAFMREVARQAGVAVEILSIRIEKLETQLKLAPVDVVTARALAALDRLLALAKPLLGPETTGLFLKGRDAAAEVAQARTLWSFDCSLVPSVTDAEASVVVLRHVADKRGD